MNIQYIEPLSRGWKRTKKALFQSFDLKKWFVVGFTAFLAGLTDCHGGGGSGERGQGRFDWGDIIYFPERAWEWLLNHPIWFMLIVFGIFVIFLLALLFTWLSSRGKFMFLDNVVHDRALVVNPWHEYRVEGNSLFVWSFSLGLLVFAIVILYLTACFSTLYGQYESSTETAVLIVPVILMVLGFLAIVILTSYIELLLYDFVVPIMYKYRITTPKAVRMFLPLFLSNFFHFLGYGLLILLLTILIVIGVIIGGFLTCCIGFVLLIIPYINAVVLLPISYTLRAFSVEFLEQFGPEYHIFPRPDAKPAEGQTMTV
jgi:hypothetical protein